MREVPVFWFWAYLRWEAVLFLQMEYLRGGLNAHCCRGQASTLWGPWRCGAKIPFGCGGGGGQHARRCLTAVLTCVCPAGYFLAFREGRESWRGMLVAIVVGALMAPMAAAHLPFLLLRALIARRQARGGGRGGRLLQLQPFLRARGCLDCAGAAFLGAGAAHQAGC